MGLPDDEIMPSDKILRKIGQLLLERRKARGKRQEDVAADAAEKFNIGLGQPDISRIEKAEQGFRFGTMLAMCDVLDYPFPKLLEDAGLPDRTPQQLTAAEKLIHRLSADDVELLLQCDRERLADVFRVIRGGERRTKKPVRIKFGSGGTPHGGTAKTRGRRPRGRSGNR